MEQLKPGARDYSENIKFPVEYFSTASNLLLGVIITIYTMLILAPIFIIRFSIATAAIMVILLSALAFGIYIFRGSPGRRNGLLSVSLGGARLESNGRYAFVIHSAGLTQVGKTVLKATQASMFETRIIFQNAEDCAKAREFVGKYY